MLTAADNLRKAETEDPGGEDRWAGQNHRQEPGRRMGPTRATLQHLGRRGMGGGVGEVQMPRPGAWGGPEGTEAQTGIQKQTRPKE